MTLPQFLIVGAPRCGTTFLAENLQLHPEVFMPNEFVEFGSGDLHFFDLHTEKGKANYDKGLSWYESIFSACESNQVPGEKTADYLGSGESARLILETLGPDTKIIILIRDPISRAYSHYLHSRHRLPIGLSFSKMVSSLRDPQDVPVLSSGLYFQLLQPYLKSFGADNIFIVANEDLQRDPQSELNRISRFLGVFSEHSFDRAKARINQSSSGLVSHLSARVGRWLNLNAPSVYEWILNGAAAFWARKLILSMRGKPVAAEGAPRPATTVISERDRLLLKEFYQEDVSRLSSFLNRDLAGLWWGQ